MKPSFFIVGAPKAGTTSLNDYLRQYDDIFIPATKELHHFGSDLASQARKNSRLTREQYVAHFEGAMPGQVAGESSVLYLSSAQAASEIYEFDASSKIIIMLRNPVDLVQSLHAQLLSQGDESEPNFLTAYEIEPARRQGRLLPQRIEHPDDGLFYSNIGSLGSHVKKFLDVFGPDQVLFVWFEDFTNELPAHCGRGPIISRAPTVDFQDQSRSSESAHAATKQTFCSRAQPSISSTRSNCENGSYLEASS